MEEFDYRDSLNFLYSLQKYGIKFGLSKTENLLNGLGRPQDRLKFVHIAGTNGKGSVATYISSVLERAGYRVGVYTSPHLVSFRERMRINSSLISPQEVALLTSQIKEVMVEEEPPTFFEAVTAMAIKYFADRDVDVVVLETGMGGRLDATNVVRPLVSIITNISLEHQDFLGNTLIEIAREKAGIIKGGIPVISGVRQGSIRLFLEEVCGKMSSPLFLVGRDFRCMRRREYFFYYGTKERIKYLKSGLLGGFQRDNLAIALCCLELLREKGFYMEEDAIREGIAQAQWDGRMHLLSSSPRIILDGAHNTSAMKALVETVREMEYDRLIAVVGVMADKDVYGIMKKLLPLCHRVIFSRPMYYRAMDPQTLKRKSPPHSNSLIIEDLKVAIERAREMGKEDDLLLITGSLFTVGEALSILMPEKYPPEEI